MELKAVTYTESGGVGLVTFNRPDRLNAWTARMALEYRWLLTQADANPEVGAVVVTGAGRGFCAGADMRGLSNMAEEGAYDDGRSRAGAVTPPWPPPSRPDFGHDHSWVMDLGIPVIAAVNGPAAGVGFVVMCYADIRFAAAGAKLTTSFGRLGLPAEHGVSWLLPRLIGPARAADLLFSSRVVLAEEAESMGLVNRVLPPEVLLPETLAYARTLVAEVSPASVRAMKAQLWADLAGDLDTSCRQSVSRMQEMIAGPDFAEGVAAFTERRPARFRPLR